MQLTTYGNNIILEGSQGTTFSFGTDGTSLKPVNLHDIVALGGDTQAVEALLKQGVSVDCLNKVGETFLLAHCKKEGNPEMALLALKYGADIHHSSYDLIRQKENMTQNTCVPLHYFVESLYKIHGSTVENDHYYSTRTFHFEWRDISADLVGSVLEAFLTRGVKIEDINCFNVGQWMRSSGRSSPYLKEFYNRFERYIYLQLLKCKCCWMSSKAEGFQPKVCVISLIYTTATIVIIAGLFLGIYGMLFEEEPDPMLTGIGGASAIGGSLFCCLAKCKFRAKKQLADSTHSNYGSV